jgi:hypothetical protein
MKGKLRKRKNGWAVEETKVVKNCFGCKSYDVIKEYQLTPDDANHCLDKDENTEVNFEVVIDTKLFTEDKENDIFAKLLPDDMNYKIKTSFCKNCEICGEHIDGWSQPTCKECFEALKELILERKEYIKKYKMDNIKPEEKVCYNCNYLIWSIGVGQGLRCGNGNKNEKYEMIPNSRHTCELFKEKTQKQDNNE